MANPKPSVQLQAELVIQRQPSLLTRAFNKLVKGWGEPPKPTDMEINAAIVVLQQHGFTANHYFATIGLSHSQCSELYEAVDLLSRNGFIVTNPKGKIQGVLCGISSINGAALASDSPQGDQ